VKSHSNPTRSSIFRSHFNGVKSPFEHRKNPCPSTALLKLSEFLLLERLLVFTRLIGLLQPSTVDNGGRRKKTQQKMQSVLNVANEESSTKRPRKPLEFKQT
jgi:hypothetical protein